MSDNTTTERRSAPQPAPAVLAARARPDAVPAWLLEFHELGLNALCRRCVRRLPARLGYADASMYLYESREGVLTLVETNHSRPIDLVVPMRMPADHLMVAVAQQGQYLCSDDTASVRQRWAPRSADHSARYPDGAALVAPLLSGGRLWGLLNFSRRQAATGPEVPLGAVFGFLGRMLRYARAYELARTQARIDALTGLFNHRWMTETLTREILRGQRFKTPLAVLMLDLDGLKAINDREGHSAGNCVLQHVAGRIASALRQFDAAARIGGDEFVILLPATDLAGATAAAGRVLEALRGEGPLFGGTRLPIRASLGVAQWQPGWDATRLLEAADLTMYQAKQQGGDQAVVRPYEPPAEARQIDGSAGMDGRGAD